MDPGHHADLLVRIKLMKELKDLIICEARAIFSAQHPGTSTAFLQTYDVVIDKKNNGDGYEYEARLILYTQPRHTEWKMLMVNPCLCMSPVDAMADLLEAMYDRASLTREGLKEGDVYRAKEST